MKKQIPNLITSCNLLCGCLAIVATSQNNLYLAALLVLLAAVFDFFDGFAARLLKVNSEMGKQMDSLADMVTFGVVPGFLTYKMVLFLENLQPTELLTNAPYLIYIPFIIPVLSAFRLAKFNLDTRQTTEFIGMPTPANTLFFISFPLIYFADLPTLCNIKPLVEQIFMSSIALLFFSILFSSLLIVEVPMFSLKFKNLQWKDNQTVYLFLTTSLILFVILGIQAIPFLIVLYLLISFFRYFKQS